MQKHWHDLLKLNLMLNLRPPCWLHYHCQPRTQALSSGKERVQNESSPCFTNESSPGFTSPVQSMFYNMPIFGKGGKSFNRVDIYNKFKRKILPQNQHKTSKKIGQRKL